MASARSSARAATLATLTLVRRPPLVSTNSGSTPNCVMVGPRFTATTLQGAPKSPRVSSISAARLRSNSSSANRSEPTSSRSSIRGRAQACAWSVSGTLRPWPARPSTTVGVDSACGVDRGGCAGVLPEPRSRPHKASSRRSLARFRVGSSPENSSPVEVPSVRMRPTIRSARKATAAPRPPKAPTNRKSKADPMIPPPRPSLAMASPSSGVEAPSSACTMAIVTSSRRLKPT